jgi:hypothetical protein
MLAKSSLQVVRPRELERMPVPAFRLPLYLQSS